LRITVWFWILSFIITIAGAYYQRVTGPTYPVTGSLDIDQKLIKYELERSHSTSSDYEISIKTDDPAIMGELRWKRYKTNDEWTYIRMINENGSLVASLPKQPPAGKLQYQIKLLENESSADRDVVIPDENPVVIRFKGDVPALILVPHIILMFIAMLLSTRTGLEYFNREPKFKKFTFWTIGFLIAGGLIFGPLTQLYAFGSLWTGVPFGFDLTDNKTLIAFIGWAAAAIAILKSKNPGKWVLGAAILFLIIYIIPHSLLGSELDYSQLTH
jgi:hypothetical protein